MEKAAVLFDNFAYGMSRREIAQRLQIENAADGTEAQSLRAPDAAYFLGQSWEELFIFDNEACLRQIILVKTSPGKELWSSVQKDLLKNGWMPVAVDSDDGACDLFERRKAEGNAEEIGIKALAEFEKEALQKERGITVYFFPADFAAKMLKKSEIKYWAAAVDKAQENFCLLSMMADADNLKLSFTAPLLARKAALKYGEMIRR